MRLRDWIEPKRSREAGLALWRGWQVHWGVNCPGVQWVYSDHIQRAFSSRSFKSKCVKGARGGICINGISWGFPRWSVEQSEKKIEKKNPATSTTPPTPTWDLEEVPQQAQVPSDSELISNHVNYCNPPLFALTTPLSISCGNKLKPGISRSSCLCRHQTYVIQGSVRK